jgi:glutathione S-transferase
MPHYKVTYFNGRGRAEIIRLTLAAGGAEFEDIRIERDQWPALKDSTPFGQIPILEVDGVKLCQSNSCARFVARKLGLAGKDELEQAKADMIVDCLEDCIKPILTFFFEKDEAKKAEGKKKYNDEQLPAFLTSLEKLLVGNNGGDKFFVGNELTWADLSFINFVGWTAMAGADPAKVLAKYPKLLALKERVEKQPKVAAWIAKRPKTEM